jgi:hypothetical protein
VRPDDLGTRLRANADVIEAQVAGVGDEQARWKPDPAQWSILEVVCHLADEEVEDFRTRLDLTLHRPGEAWPSIDPEGWAIERRYNEKELAESLERFLTRRAETLVWLGGLTAPDWERAYQHPRFGPIRAGDLLISWVAHDHIHIRQLNRLHREFLVASLPGNSPRYAGRW